MGVKRLLLLTLVTVCYAGILYLFPPTVELNYSPNNNSGVNVTCSAKARPAPVVQLFLWGSNVTANATRTEVNQTDQNLTTVVLTLQLDGINGKDLKCRVLHGNATYIQTLLHTWTWEGILGQDGASCAQTENVSSVD
ncbi:membrane glycoprotein vOX2-B [Elephant endotheliotropic herpesvirus 3A]|uniref:Membrane glycoprotein vOX2-B n=1 Tax=Elephant endotheliotropic herpesvirus 3A TaxID=1329409 RepID=A0A866VSR5_9BETA|nr:membrane glycoprotein vOX2-B [Elephant endotheliotropic herpesvirus 3A]QOE74398.1 membrane glycoprotein vOX2-B [Elephant endotheliotropic herpesvirus 3A]